MLSCVTVWSRFWSSWGNMKCWLCSPFSTATCRPSQAACASTHVMSLLLAVNWLTDMLVTGAVLLLTPVVKCVVARHQRVLLVCAAPVWCTLHCVFSSCIIFDKLVIILCCTFSRLQCQLWVYDKAASAPCPPGINSAHLAYKSLDYSLASGLLLSTTTLLPTQTDHVQVSRRELEHIQQGKVSLSHLLTKVSRITQVCHLQNDVNRHYVLTFGYFAVLVAVAGGDGGHALCCAAIPEICSCDADQPSSCVRYDVLLLHSASQPLAYIHTH